jgi:alkylation response protein AidB-like acyl-CoA dehydrogenase
VTGLESGVVEAASSERSDEHEQLAVNVRAFLARTSPEAEVRRLIVSEAGFNAEVWRLMADQLGLQGLIVPVEFGGSGFSHVELGVVLEEMGAALYCGPFYATVALAANALLSSGDRAAMARHLPGIAGGDVLATVAMPEGWPEACEAHSLVATRVGDRWQLDGVARFVLDGVVADLILVVARTGSGLTLFSVQNDAAGLSRTAMRTLDPTRRLAVLDFAGTPAMIVGSENDGARILERTVELALVALAAEQVGATGRCLDIAVDYACTRHQFGRPIGSFQAIKHMCADMLVEFDTARAIARAAAVSAASTAVDLPILAALAKWRCSDALIHVSEQTISVLGGIGVTWEHSAHLYYRRAMSAALLLGGSTHYRSMVAAAVFD